VFVLTATFEPVVVRGTRNVPFATVVVAILLAVVAIPVKSPISFGVDKVPVMASYLKEVLMLIGTLVPELQRGTYQAVPVVVVVVAILLAVVQTPVKLPINVGEVNEPVMASYLKEVFMLIGTLVPELQRGTYQEDPVVVVVVAILLAVVAIPVILPKNVGDDNVPVEASNFREVLMLIGTLEPELQRGTYQPTPVVVVVVAILLAVVAIPVILPKNVGHDNVPVDASNFKVLQILIGTLVPELHRGTYQAEPVVVVVVVILVAVDAIPVKLPKNIGDDNVLVVALYLRLILVFTVCAPPFPVKAR